MSLQLEPADERLVVLALGRLSAEELERIHLQIFFEAEAAPVRGGDSVACQALALLAGRLARERREATEPQAQVDAAQRLIRLREVVSDRFRSSSGRHQRALARLVEAYRRLVGRGIRPVELEAWLAARAAGHDDQPALEQELRRIGETERIDLDRPRAPDSCWIMGTNRSIDLSAWRDRGRALGAASPAGAAAARLSGLPGSPRCLVSVITSVYAGGSFIEDFMANICSQTIFRDWCELIVIDAASPEGEGAVVRRWMRAFPNIRYIRTADRIGIYEAWNLGVREARGELLTNANVDDLRRSDSLEIQAATLLALPAVDVVYQNVFYALESGMTFERVAAFGWSSRMPLVTPAVMLSLNPPHNAPMWRRRLHDELGLFDTSCRSAGDYEFWLRCVAAGKIFHRVCDPHVAYFHNPLGCSTRADTTGHRETRQITSAYSLRLLGLEGAPAEVGAPAELALPRARGLASGSADLPAL